MDFIRRKCITNNQSTRDEDWMRDVLDLEIQSKWLTIEDLVYLTVTTQNGHGRSSSIEVAKSPSQLWDLVRSRLTGTGTTRGVWNLPTRTCPFGSIPSRNKGLRRELTDLCGMCEKSPRTARARVRRTQFYQNMPPTNDFYHTTAVRCGFHFIRLNKKNVS